MALARDGTASLFSGSAAGTLRLIIYLAIACVLMVTDHRDGWLQQARYAASAAIEPIYRIASLPADLIESGSIMFAERKRLSEQNDHLREALLLANARLNRMGAVSRQNVRLKALLDVQHVLGMNAQLARLLNVDLGPFRNRIVLNIGAAQGVRVGQTVVDAHGVMGQIIALTPHTATAMLITDPSHAVPVVVERTGLRSVAYGTGASGHLQLPDIPMSADIRVGDMLTTSGIGGRFPLGFPVGRVVSVGPDDAGMFNVAEAEPAAAMDRSGEVLLLRDLPEPVGPPAPARKVGPPAPAGSSAATEPVTGAGAESP